MMRSLTTNLMPFKAALFLTVACAALLPQRAFAITRTWTAPVSGDFNTANNWTPVGVPDATDTAVISVDGTYTVSLSATTPVGALTLGGGTGTQTLDLAGQSFSIAGASTVNSNGVLALHDGTFSGFGTLSVASGGVFNWNGGTIQGSSTSQNVAVAAGGVLNIVGGFTRTPTLDKRTISNFGTINVTNSGTLTAQNRATINNENGGVIEFSHTDGGTWNATGTDTSTICTLNNKVGAVLRKTSTSDTASTFAVSGFSFNNNGTLDAQKGTFQITSVDPSTSSGTFQAAANSTIAFSNGEHVLDGATFTGAGTCSFSGAFITLVNTISAQNISLNSGTLDGDGALNVAGTFNWLQGQMSGTGTTTIASGATLNINSGGTATNARPLSIGGTLNLSTATLTGAGTVTIASGGVWNWGDYGRMTGTSTSQSTIIAAGGTANLQSTAGGTPFLTQRTLSNSGTLNCADGIGLSLTNGAVLANENGALVDISSGQATFGGSGTALCTFNNKAGAMLRKRANDAAGLFSNLKVTNNGTFDVQRGTLAISNGSSGNFTNLAANTLTGGTYLVTGTLSVPTAINTNAANLTLNTSTAGVVVNQTSTNALANFKSNVATGNLTLTSGKTLTISAGVGNFQNAGNVTLDGGTLSVAGTDKNYVQTAGSTTLSGGVLLTTATGKADIQGGTISGSGFVNTTLSNAATVNPGVQAGLISVSQNYTQTGALNIQLGGTNAQTPDYDQLSVAGTVTLGGTLNISAINGFVPSDGDVFTLISNGGADAVVGTFTGLAQGDAIAVNGKTLRISYAGGDGNDVVLSALPGISISNSTFSESVGTASLGVTLTEASAQTVTVQYQTANGTALAPDDFSATAGTLTFAPGETSKTISVSIQNDTTDEADETFGVTLSAPSNAFLSNGQGVGTITDDDADPTISISGVSLSEGNTGTSNAVFQVVLNTISGQAVTVQYATNDGTATAGSDYTAASGTLSIPAGQASGTITVKITGDTLLEGDELFNVTLSNPTHAFITSGTAVGTILNDDVAPSFSISDVNVTESNSQPKTASFVVTRVGDTSAASSVDFATANGTATSPGDFTARLGTLSFAAGETTKIIDVSVVGDTIDEADETFQVNLSNAVGSSIADAQGLGVILDNDAAPTVSILDATEQEGSNLSFKVQLSALSEQTVTVDYSVAAGTAKANTDYTATNGTLTIPAGQIKGTITVAALLDSVDEGSENFFVNLTAPTNTTLSDAQGKGIILDSPTVSGTITNYRVDPNNSSLTQSVPYVGVTVNMGNFTATTDSTGTYKFVGVPSGNYSVVPQPIAAGDQFAPVSKPVTVTTTDVVSVNFKSLLILGRVYKLNTAGAKVGFAAADVKLDGVSRATTDANGFYAVRKLGNGTYSVSTSVTGFTFPTKTVTLPTSGTTGVSPNGQANFQGTKVTGRGDSSAKTF